MASSTTMHAWSDYVMPESERTLSWSEVNYATSGSCTTELSNTKQAGASRDAILMIDGEYSSICDYTNVVANLGKSA